VSKLDLVELTKTLVSNLVNDKDSVQINLIEEDKVKIIQVLVKEEDVASVIGKRGSIANAIRTLVQASAYINKLGSVRVNIDSL
jgi:predicted RNA-binding protein YlqC (UPF0109 family)